jgi:hypothetical protein
MNRPTSLPIKLAEIRRDLHEFLQTEPAGGAHRELIDEADKAIDKVIREFDLDGERLWITMNRSEDTGSN